MTRIYLGWIDVDPSPRAKLTSKHGIDIELVREAIQAPAKARAAVEDHPEHGWRVVATGSTGGGRIVIAALTPLPEYEWEGAETWICRSARWLD